MTQFKKYGIPALILIAALIVNLLLAILLHGYFMAVIQDPFTIQGLTEVFEDQADSQLLDTYADGDSALTLLKKADGNVFLLEFHKNLLLDRYQLMDVVHVVEDAREEHLPVGTVLRSYSVLVKDHKTLTNETADSHHINFSVFFLLYLLNALLLTGMEFIVWKTGKNFKKSKAAQKKK